MKKALLFVMLAVIVTVLFSACGEDPDDVGEKDIKFGVFELTIPDYYDTEPTTKSKDEVCYMRPNKEDMCQLILTRIPYDGVYSNDVKMDFLESKLDDLGLENIDSWGGDDIEFTGEKDGVKMQGKIDSIYCEAGHGYYDVDEGEVVVVTVIYKEDKDSPYYYSDDINDTIYNSKVDGYDGAFAITTDDVNDASNSNNDSQSDDWDTDNNGDADWRDVDTNNDGEVSSDEMTDYAEDWEKEEKNNK